MRQKTSKERIIELMDVYSLKPTDFCKRTGLQKSAVSNYLNGDRVPRQDVLIKIADAFQISPAWLMGYDVQMEMIPRQVDHNISDFEYELIVAYRQADEFDKTTVRRTLGIEQEKKAQSV